MQALPSRWAACSRGSQDAAKSTHSAAAVFKALRCCILKHVYSLLLLPLCFPGQLIKSGARTHANRMLPAARSTCTAAYSHQPAPLPPPPSPGATTNSDSGVTDVLKVVPTLRAMAQAGLLLLVHGEVTDSEVDMFDREAVFIRQKLVGGGGGDEPE